MQRESLEVMLDAHTCVFNTRDYLLTQPGVSKAKIVTCDTLRVYYDADKIAAKLIVKAIGRCSKKKNSRNRQNNILSLRQINAATETTEAALSQETTEDN